MMPVFTSSMVAGTSAKPAGLGVAVGAGVLAGGVALGTDVAGVGVAFGVHQRDRVLRAQAARQRVAVRAVERVGDAVDHVVVSLHAALPLEQRVALVRIGAEAVQQGDAATDAVRVARLHRGEIGVEEAIDFLVRHTGFERPNAEAEVRRYTYTPTYQLSYLLGKVLLLRLRDDEKRRLGDQFSLRRFHDSLLYAGSLPISFQRRAMAGEGTETPIPVAAR